MVISARVSFGSALLFTKLVSSTRRRVKSGRPKLDTEVTNYTGPDKPFIVLEPQIYPESVPGENIFFMWKKVDVVVVSDTRK